MGWKRWWEGLGSGRLPLICPSQCRPEEADASSLLEVLVSLQLSLTVLARAASPGSLAALPTSHRNPSCPQCFTSGFLVSTNQKVVCAHIPIGFAFTRCSPG